MVNWGTSFTKLREKFTGPRVQIATPPIQAISSVADWIDPVPWIDLTGIEMALPLATYIDRDPLPLPAASQREGYHGERHYDYWLSGLKDYLLVKQRLAHHGRELSTLGSIFELGCASGRVLRHFLCQEPQLQVWGSDLNGAHIRWLLEYLGTRGRFCQNAPYPHLPLEDNSIGLVMAFSVFTHIDEYETAWLAELRRILQPGGIAYITLHTDHTWQILGPRHALYHGLLSIQDERNGTLRPENFMQPFPGTRIAYRWRVPEGVHTNVFHAHDYLQTQWARFFTVLDVIPEGSDYQDVIILRKEM